LLGVYALAMRAVFLYEKKHAVPSENADPLQKPESDTLRKVLAVYSLHALIVVSAALFLPYFGKRIADNLGLTETFFGTVFLAITTSLPEIVVSFSALRLGVLDMAMANLLGSNVFNIAILAFTDFFYTAGSLYASVSKQHILSIFSSITMTAIVTIGLMVRPEQKKWRLSIDAWLILIIYLVTIFML
jgi:cation:H+ antiporter